MVSCGNDASTIRNLFTSGCAFNIRYGLADSGGLSIPLVCDLIAPAPDHGIIS